MSNPSLTVVVPAYNEQAALPTSLPPLLECCERRGWKLIVVDDGSTDGTAAALDAFSDRPCLRVIRHKLNRGYGGALKSGIAAAESDYVVTVDADGQHRAADLEVLLEALIAEQADMVIGRRVGAPAAGWYRELGKALIRFVAHVLMEFKVHDINSGMKIYDTGMAQRYLHLCPNTMAFSDVITLVFISERRRVLEREITVNPRTDGESTISTATALDTLREILNIVVLFNPMRIFLPIAAGSVLLGILWGLPIVLRGHGVSVGAMLAILTGTVFFLLGLLAEQVSQIRRR